MGFRQVVKAVIPRKLFRKIEPAGHLGEAVLLNTANGFPARGLKIIGVTGTNGKTTTAFLIQRMMAEAGYKVGLMSTVGYGVGKDIKPQIEHYTNVKVPVLMKRLKQIKDQGAEWLVLETTSHALAQNRVWGIPYSVGVMTNVTHEHLDYHGTFERYRDAKRKLFKLVNRNRQGLQTGIVNADDPSAELFVSNVDKAITYGIKNGNLRASKIKMTPRGSSFEAKIGGQVYNITCHLPGSFNVYNSLAAVAVGKVIGLSRQQIEQGIAALDSVAGRMVRVEAGQDFDVIVDFAHTPDSFEKLFKDIRPLVKGKMIVMFGSPGGPRDTAKRPLQGEIAGRYADIVVLTEEDDRDTPGQQILDEIGAGAEKAGKVKDKDLFLVHDRAEAIKFALSQAKTDDTVLLLGKGHEPSIERADGEHPWDEVGTATKLIKSLK